MSRYRCVVMTTKYLPFLFLSMLTLESVAYGADVPTTLGRVHTNSERFDDKSKREKPQKQNVELLKT
jgi:hypothetical protein